MSGEEEEGEGQVNAATSSEAETDDEFSDSEDHDEVAHEAVVVVGAVDTHKETEADEAWVLRRSSTRPLEFDGGKVMVGDVLIESVAEVKPWRPSHHTLPAHLDHILEEIV